MNLYFISLAVLKSVIQRRNYELVILWREDGEVLSKLFALFEVLFRK